MKKYTPAGLTASILIAASAVKDLWVAVMVSFRRSPGSEHGVGVMFDVGCSRITSSFSNVAFLLFSLLFAYVSHHICIVAAATSPLYPFLSHQALLVLITMVMGLLSPRGSQIIQQQLQVQVIR